MNKKKCDKKRHMIWDEKLCKCICNKNKRNYKCI